MRECPKCGSTKIIGPKFVKAYWQEALRYECFQCGYVIHGPTVEQERQQQQEVKP